MESNNNIYLLRDEIIPPPFTVWIAHPGPLIIPPWDNISWAPRVPLGGAKGMDFGRRRGYLDHCTVVEVTLLLPKRNLTKVFFEGCSRSVVDVGPPSPSNRQPPTLSRLSQPGEGGG